MGRQVVVPGARDVRGTLDTASADDATAAVVACPPHPQHGGSRTDTRLRAVSDALVERGVDCLRFDYGPWDGGDGERRDAENAVGWARERYANVGLFGYSFGGSVALLVAATAAEPPCAVSALAPGSRLGSGADAVDVAAAVDRVARPVQVVYGERDTAVDSAPVVDRVRDRGGDVVAMAADHFYVGQTGKVGERVAEFLVGHC